AHKRNPVESEVVGVKMFPGWISYQSAENTNLVTTREEYFDKTFAFNRWAWKKLSHLQELILWW
ncbi:unnamed protein product, partial [Amoebophrya sp. A25]